MRRNGFVFLGGLVLSLILGPWLYASENVSESDLVYRQATLKALVAESQHEKIYPRRELSHDLLYFQNAEDPSPMELEPVGPSIGDVVGA